MPKSKSMSKFMRKNTLNILTCDNGMKKHLDKYKGKQPQYKTSLEHIKQLIKI